MSHTYLHNSPLKIHKAYSAASRLQTGNTPSVLPLPSPAGFGLPSSVSRLLSSVFFLFLLTACMPKTEYDRVKEREMASGKTVNEIFLDLYFEMGKKEFFGTCWEHNKNGILTNGGHHLQIHYRPEVSSGKAVNMFFYPQFKDNKLVFMPVEFLYRDWFPGQEEFFNDHLMEDVVQLLESWYGEGFFEVSNSDNTISAMVKVDGNRLIRVFKKNISTVRVEIFDLRHTDLKS